MSILGPSKKELLEPVEPIWGRLAGSVLLLFAVGISVLLGWAIYIAARRLFNGYVPEAPGTFALVFITILVGTAAFCWYAGVRLVLNRPSRSGGVLDSTGWTVLGLGFVGATLLIAVPVFEAKDWMGLRVLVGTLTLAGYCLYLARRARDRRESLFPADGRESPFAAED